MILVIAGIGALLLAAGIFVYIKWGRKLYSSDKEVIYYSFNIVGCLILIISLFVALVMGIKCSNARVIDEKIALYEEENTRIEQVVNDAVVQYMQYETDTYTNLRPTDPTVLVTLYPELKTNELVAKQLDLYVKNNNTIKELRCEKLDYKVLAWWLFFGQ